MSSGGWRRFAYTEPVAFWGLTIYFSSISYRAFIRPYFTDDSNKVPKHPPSLKQVLKGIDEKLNAK